mmetsp:Transcript_34575/g.83498  ORF Transcript_34575/g.83498 Transcript_34575/m.83498 type:complete len:352 (+) Transcript_34575:67-1122(+)
MHTILIIFTVVCLCYRKIISYHIISHHSTTKTMLPFTYQKAAKDETEDVEAVVEASSSDDNKEDVAATLQQKKVVASVGYGSAENNNVVEFDPATDFGPSNADAEPASRRKKRWAMLLAGAVLYVAVASFWNSHKLQGSMAVNESTQDIELLGKSKEKKDAKKARKDKKKADKKAKKALETKPPKPPLYTSYPGCTAGVEIKYIQTPMAFEDHEIFANASGCHLASVHTMEEFSKMSFGGLFKMAFGPEIAMSFMSGKPLSKVFWLGGYLMDGDVDAMEWTDGSDYDFGPDFANATEGCLTSSVNFTELNMPIFLPDDHWKTEDCEMPLPAVYKCCIEPPTPPPADDAPAE